MLTVVSGFALVAVKVATSYSLLPDKLDLLDGMVLGAGIFTGLGGGIGLIRGRTADAASTGATTGAVIGLVVGALFVGFELLFAPAKGGVLLA
jgi:hypothetical protein